jgi:hypothetical protein
VPFALNFPERSVILIVPVPVGHVSSRRNHRAALAENLSPDMPSALAEGGDGLALPMRIGRR